MRASLKQIRVLLIMPVVVVVIGAVGFWLLDDISFFDAFYFTVVTISTVGYGDISPTTTGAKILSMVIIVIGIGTFFTIVTSLTQTLVTRNRDRLRQQRLQMLVGIFFTEVGNQLLEMLVKFDPDIETIRNECLIDADWASERFAELKKRLQKHEFAASHELIDLEMMRGFLREKGDMLIRQIENTDLLERESFTELVWAVIHLRDELLARKDLTNLPDSDIAHLAGDIQRIYGMLAHRWLDYLQHLKRQYPFLFSLAVRTNPFCEAASPIVE